MAGVAVSFLVIADIALFARRRLGTTGNHGCYLITGIIGWTEGHNAQTESFGIICKRNDLCIIRPIPIIPINPIILMI